MHARTRLQLAAAGVIPLGLTLQLLAPVAPHASAAPPVTQTLPASLSAAAPALRSVQSLLADAERVILEGKGEAALRRFLDTRPWPIPASVPVAATGHASFGAAASDSATATSSGTPTPAVPSTTTATATPAGGMATATSTPGAGSAATSPTAGSATATATPPPGSATITATNTASPIPPPPTATRTASATATRTPVPLIPNTAPFTGPAVRSVARAALPDVVLIAVHGTAGTRTGTGFVIRSDQSGAYALTTAGTLGAATAAQVTITSPIDGRSYPATAVKVAKGSPAGATDLGIVRFAAKGLKALHWADSQKTVAGQPVLSVAYTPGEGGPPALYEGIVSAVHRDLGDGAGPIWIQHQTPLDARAGGSPLLDFSGAVLGINVKGKYVRIPGGRGQLLGVFYAAPASSIRSLSDALIAASRGAVVPRLSGTTYAGSGYTLTLPSGWTTKKSSGGSALVSADGRVLVAVVEQDLAATVSDDILKKQLATSVTTLGNQLSTTFSVTYRAITIGALHGLTAVLTNSDHSIGGLASALSDGQHLLAIIELYPSGTPQTDLDQANALTASIVVTGGGSATGSSPGSGSATPVPTPSPQAGTGSRTGGVYNGKGYSVRLPSGWSVQKLKDGTPVIVSGDGTVVAQISEDTLQAALSDDQIKAVIAKLGDSFSKQDGVTYAIAYSPVRAGTLHGIVGTLTAAGKSTISVTVLESGSKVINALAIFDQSASQADRAAYATLIGSLALGSAASTPPPGDSGLS